MEISNCLFNNNNNLNLIQQLQPTKPPIHVFLALYVCQNQGKGWRLGVGHSDSLAGDAAGCNRAGSQELPRCSPMASAKYFSPCEMAVWYLCPKQGGGSSSATALPWPQALGQLGERDRLGIVSAFMAPLQVCAVCLRSISSELW